MKCIILLNILLFSYLINGDDSLVNVHQGIVRGRFLVTPGNTTFRAFQGVPYAKPPLGNLRFQAPEPLEPWDGIVNASGDANICYAIESDSPLESEDCLYLNIYTPILSNANKTKVPVMLWIHGGGYSHGNSLYNNFGPDFLIEKDIVIVTINYRLGPFGFLATGDTVIPGNAGHKDQSAAIKWTYENIIFFGGDPLKITITGQSAGASSVGYQLLYEKNQGLFRGAILESGSPLSPWSMLDLSKSREYAFDLAKQIDESIDLQNSSTLLLEFLTLSDAKTIDIASTATSISRPSPVIEPEHDGAFLTESQYTKLEQGKFIHVPIIIGTNSEEEIHQGADLDALYQTLQKYEKNPEKFIPGDFRIREEVNKTLVQLSIKDLYLKDVPADEKMGHIIKFLSHTSFTTPMIKHADLVANFTDVYFYVFSYDGPMGNVNVTVKGADKVDHAEDPKYLFKKSDSSYSNEDLSKFPKSDVLTHYRLIELWTNFVKCLNPTPEASVLLQNLTWPKFTRDSFKFVDIGNNLEIHKNPKNPYYNAWVQFYEDWAKKPFTTF